MKTILETMFNVKSGTFPSATAFKAPPRTKRLETEKVKAEVRVDWKGQTGNRVTKHTPVLERDGD